MARHGYSYVTDKGFASFGRTLGEGAWGGLDVAAIDDEGAPPVARSPLVSTSLAVIWKLQASWAIRELLRAMGTASVDDLLTLDEEWDSSQRALNLALLAETEHRDPDRRAGAQRLREALLLGNGTAQTQLSYDREVDFGRAQAELAGKPPLSADVAAAGLLPLLTRIHEATEALAKGLGRGPGSTRPLSRARWIRQAQFGCSAAFNVIHAQIDWALAHASGDEERQQLQALRGPLLALLERYPRTARTEEEDDDDNGEADGDDEPAADADAPEAGA